MYCEETASIYCTLLSSQKYQKTVTQDSVQACVNKVTPIHSYLSILYCCEIVFRLNKLINGVYYLVFKKREYIYCFEYPVLKDWYDSCTQLGSCLGIHFPSSPAVHKMQWVIGLTVFNKWSVVWTMNCIVVCGKRDAE